MPELDGIEVDAVPAADLAAVALDPDAVLLAGRGSVDVAEPLADLGEGSERRLAVGRVDSEFRYALVEEGVLPEEQRLVCHL